MKLFIYHGRLAPDTGATDVDGNDVDDWGFEGPELTGIKWQDFTYNNFYIGFRTEEDRERARKLTGWQDGVHGDDLIVEFSDDRDLIRIHNAERNRDEFFGDWMLWDDADHAKEQST